MVPGRVILPMIPITVFCPMEIRQVKKIIVWPVYLIYLLLSARQITGSKKNISFVLYYAETALPFLDLKAGLVGFPPLV